ncbi:MAG: nicotinate (nicotinamide) nucleotide adenylyltransferase [bacterium]|nr:MAG: nicotinate (nicotinamide) nucleotide adenylyltransferase [bacterium]
MDGREKIGLFGGSFDPIHTGHLILAESARSWIGLERIIFLPTAIPPHKNHTGMTSYEVRARMVELAIEDNPNFELSTLEGQWRVSYTYETVLHFKDEGYGKEQVHLLIGSDTLGEIHSWKNPELIFSHATIVVLMRPGYEKLPILPDGAAVVMIETGSNSISATEIRKRVSEKRSIRYLVPGSVERFIQEHSLYSHPA